MSSVELQLSRDDCALLRGLLIWASHERGDHRLTQDERVLVAELVRALGAAERVFRAERAHPGKVAVLNRRGDEIATPPAT